MAAVAGRRAGGEGLSAPFPQLSSAPEDLREGDPTMPRLSACIEMIFRDLPFTDRIAATKAAGLDTVEFWGWRNKDLDAVQKACGEHGVTVATFGMDTGGPLT